MEWCYALFCSDFMNLGEISLNLKTGRAKATGTLPVAAKSSDPAGRSEAVGFDMQNKTFLIYSGAIITNSLT